MSLTSTMTSSPILEVWPRSAEAQKGRASMEDRMVYARSEDRDFELWLVLDGHGGTTIVDLVFSSLPGLIWEKRDAFTKKNAAEIFHKK